MKIELTHRFSLYICLYPLQLFVLLIVYPPAGDVHILPVCYPVVLLMAKITTCKAQHKGEEISSSVLGVNS